MSASEVAKLVERIRPILAGKGAPVHAVLADLLAIFLAGHPADFRETLLDMHVTKVRELIEQNAKILGTDR